MYKSKLQELCHRRRWALPRYTYMKDGEEHCPNFKASVVVNRVTFDTPAICKKSKEALNEAAKVAFLHFNSETSSQSSDNEENNSEVENNSEMECENDLALEHHDVNPRFRKKLQIYAKDKNLGLPVYYTKREGLNDLCFRTKVNVGEEWFQNQVLYRTVEEAEDDAAQEALSSLTMDEFHENDPYSYKNLLRDLTDDEGLLPPMYRTKDSDEPYYRTFSSIVEVGGIIFQGAAAKSKKLAELNAAKVAYSSFMERKLFESRYYLEFSPRSVSIMTLSLEDGSSSSFSPCSNLQYCE